VVWPCLADAFYVSYCAAVSTKGCSSEQSFEKTYQEFIEAWDPQNPLMNGPILAVPSSDTSSGHQQALLPQFKGATGWCNGWSSTTRNYRTPVRSNKLYIRTLLWISVCVSSTNPLTHTSLSTTGPWVYDNSAARQIRPRRRPRRRPRYRPGSITTVPPSVGPLSTDTDYATN